MGVSAPDRCLCCGSKEIVFTEILWPRLISEWHLADYEVEYINRQQGMHCAVCNSNLRSMALALAIMRCFGYDGLFAEFVKEASVQSLKILEINEAGNLTQFLARAAGHQLKKYPEIDILEMPYADNSFDLAVHSDTLEHVTLPVRALTECGRILKPGRFCAFTVPMVVDRLTSSRAGRPASYHDTPEQRGADYVVHTEYGGDTWKQVIQAGFRECRIFSVEYPSAQAFVGVKDRGRLGGA